jgi:hypothetical protein
VNPITVDVEKLGKELFGIEDDLFLNESFRCPKIVTNHIRKNYVPDFYSFHKNKEGQIIDEETDQFIRLIKNTEDCFVLARANATLLQYFLECLKNNIPAVLEKTNLDTVVKQIYLDCSRRDITIEQRLADRLSEIARAPYSDFRRQIFIRSETDNHQSALLLLNFIQQPTFMAAANKVDQFFKEAERGDNTISFCTIHRSKGRQRKIGYLLLYKIKSEDAEETINIPYVVRKGGVDCHEIYVRKICCIGQHKLYLCPGSCKLLAHLVTDYPHSPGMMWW